MNRIITTGLASYGMSGQIFHAPLLHVHKGFRLKKIVERHQNLSVMRYPAVEIVRNYEALLIDSEIELIIVNVPDHLHFPMALEALRAGKHVVVEKPFTLHEKHCQQLISEATRRQRMLSVYQNRRWDGGFLTVQKILRQNILGRIVEFEARFDRYRNYIVDSWKENPENGTENIYNLGSHLIDQSLVLFGVPTGVFADIQAQREGARVNDAFELRLYYPDKRVILKSSYLVKEPGPAYALYGTNGCYIKHGSDPQEDMLKKGHFPDEEDWGAEESDRWGLLHAQVDGNDYRRKHETVPGNYLAYYDNIYNHLIYDHPLEVTAEQASLVIRIIEKSILSNREKRIIEV